MRHSEDFAELYQMYRTIEAGTGIQVKKMIGSGNGVRKNPIFCEMIGEMFQSNVTLSEYEEEAAAGAALSSLFYAESADH